MINTPFSHHLFSVSTNHHLVDLPCVKVAQVPHFNTSALGEDRLGDGDVGGAGGLVTLGGDNLVVVLAELHAQLGPGVEVVGGSDSSRGALVLADRPVLVEGGGTLDGRLLSADTLVDIVDGAVSGDGTHVGETAAGVVGAVGLEDVVLNQGVGAPSVDGEVRVALGRVATLEVDVAGRAGGPSLAGNEVVAVLPADGVLAGTLVVAIGKY